MRACLALRDSCRQLCLLSLLCSSLAVFAAESSAIESMAVQSGVSADLADFPAGSAHQLIAATTDDLIALIHSSADYISEDEARFYRELDGLLRPLIDFRAFARAVMGRHASGKKMAGLAAGERAQLDRQVDRFSEVFSTALIHTYGKGLLAFEGQTIDVVPPASSDSARTKAQVRQLIYGDRPEPYEIYYSLRKDQRGQWKLRNLIVESINLGKVYRNQFDNAYHVYQGDIDQVIDTWSAAPATNDGEISE